MPVGKITYPPPVKLIAGLLSAHPEKLDVALAALAQDFGPTDLQSEPTAFDHTDYYAAEMGENLKRQYVSFAKLIGRESLPAVKLLTNKLEAKMTDPVTGGRRVNVDPGYVALEQMVLATTKGYGHRVYLKDGIYGELTYRYRNKSYRPLDWTYPDYREEGAINFFNAVRRRYVEQIRHLRELDGTPAL